MIFCGECDHCRAGETNLCEDRRVIGVLEWDDALGIIANELDQAARVARGQWARATA